MTKLLLAGVAALGIAAAAARSALAPTITPTTHDFGDNVLNVPGNWGNFTVTLPGGGNTNSLVGRITGPDQSDFRIDRQHGLFRSRPSPSDCSNEQVPGISAPPPAGTCEIVVEFIPHAPGPKTATLTILEPNGGQVSATLKGNGVPGCRLDIVPCNYAFLYSGNVSWSGGDAGANVDVKNGVASCNASGDTELTSGPGLIAVEFDESDDEPSPFYRIRVACPTRYPPEPARPAELGHGEFGSYKQPLGKTVYERVLKRLPWLMGRNAETGDIVSWNLCRNAQYVPPDSTTQGPHDPCPAP